MNCHPDLVRYARWWQGEQEAKAAKVKIPDEDVDASYFNENRRRPPSSTSSWDAVSVMTPEKTKTGRGYAKNTKRQNEGLKTEGEMESQPDPAVLEEIKALETKLAVLKDKARSSGH